MKKALTIIVISLLCVSVFSILAPKVMGWASSVPSTLHGNMTYDALEGTGWSILDRTEIALYASYEGHIADYYHRVGDYQTKLHEYHVPGHDDECKCFEQGKYGGAEDGAYQYIQWARSNYTIGNIAEARKSLGYAIHFIQDSFCPPHVFPFSERLLDTAHWKFEENTASFYGTIWNDWQSRVTNAPEESITSAEDLRQKIVRAVHDDVEIKFPPPQCSYVRQDGTIVGDLSGTIWGWKMSETDIGSCMERAARLVKGAAAWAHTLAFDAYHSYSEIESGLRSLESSGIAKVESIGLSVEGRQIWAIKISDDPNVDDQDEPDVLFVGLHHAREWISAEVPYYLAVNLVKNYNSDSALKTLIDNSEIWVVPVVNPDGLEYSRTQDRDWRKNRRDNGDGTFGVDLNRNYGYMWGLDSGSSGVTSAPDYRGPYAFSEPEVVAIRDLISNPAKEFEVVLSYHSYYQLILYPWGYTNELAPDTNVMGTLAAEMSDLIRNVHGENYTPEQASQLYLTSGDLTDWVYGTRDVPAFTVELRPERWQYIPGFELPESQILDTCEENWPAALYLARWVVLSQGGFMDFENGVDQLPIRSTIPGMAFTTTMGYDWIYGDIRTGGYNVNPYGSRAYECHGNVFAWLGPNQGSGRIDFTGATAGSISMLTSTAYGTYLDAYDSSGNLLGRSFAGGNIYTGTMSETKVIASNIAYVIVHDSGNYWLIDDLRVSDLLRETNAFQSQDSASVFQTLDLIDSGASSIYEFSNSQLQSLKILLNWKGSKLGIQVSRPDGTVFAETESENPPIRIVVPAAEPGTWKIVVTALDVPYNDYPFALDVASVPLPSDIEPPATKLEMGSPRFTDSSDNIFVTSSTPFTLTAEDDVDGSGVAITGYRIRNATYDSGWTASVPPIEFYLTALVDGEYSIDFNSTDNAGNVELTKTDNIILDNTAPSVAIMNPPAGWALQDGVHFIISAVDTGSGGFSVNCSIREVNGSEGKPVGFEDLPAGYNATTGKWTLFFDTLQLPDGYYVVLVKAKDNLEQIGSTLVSYSIRNWAVLELLPASENNKAGRTMPVKFALRVAASVDPNQPFVYNEDLTINIYATNNPSKILQTSTYGETARDYRISTASEKYITNFQTLKTPMQYTVSIWRGNFLVGTFTFKTVK